MRNLRPTTWVAAGFIVLGGGLMLFDALSNMFAGWVPNLGASAFEIAATILIVDRVFGREVARRNRPRVELVMSELRYALLTYADSVAQDYAATHVHNYRPIPREITAMFDQWIQESDTHDACTLLDGARLSLILADGTDLGASLRDLRESDREVMEPAIVRAIDDFLWSGIGHGLNAANRRWGGPTGQASGVRLGEKLVVDAAYHLVQVFLEHDSARRSSFVFDDLTINAMEIHNRHQREHNGPIER
jgi:hypothetical protein